MKNFFKMMLFVLLFSGNAYSQEAQEAQKTKAVDPNAPAPAAPVQISVPHTGRTKGNILDAALDFVFVRFFKTFKNAEISYDFFEIDAERNLNFTNFMVKVKRPDVEGTVTIQKTKINFSEFMETLKSQTISATKITLEKVSGDLTIIKKSKPAADKTAGQTSAPVNRNRVLKFKADETVLKDVAVAFWSSTPEKENKTIVGNLLGKNIKVALSNPEERYAVSLIDVKDIKIPKNKIKDLTIASATADGKEYADKASLLRALKQQ